MEELEGPGMADLLEEKKIWRWEGDGGLTLIIVQRREEGFSLGCCNTAEAGGRGVGIRVLELGAGLGEHRLRRAVDIGASPGVGGGDGEGDTREADLCEGIPVDPGEVPGHVYALADHVLEGHPADGRDGVGVEMVAWVRSALAGEVDRSAHVYHADVGDDDVLDVAASARGGLQLYAGEGIADVDVLGAYVCDAAGHLAADGEARSVGGPELDPFDVDVGDGLAIGEAVLVPTALQGNGIAPHGDRAVLNPHVGG